MLGSASDYIIETAPSVRYCYDDVIAVAHAPAPKETAQIQISNLNRRV